MVLVEKIGELRFEIEAVQGRDSVDLRAYDIETHKLELYTTVGTNQLVNLAAFFQNSSREINLMHNEFAR